MTILGTVLAGLILLSGGPEATSAIDPAAFRAWYDAAARGRLSIPVAVADRAAGFRYVFVAGLGGEAMPGYFAQNARELRAIGVPRGAIHVVRPGSGKTVAENCGEVRDEIVRIAGLGPERLVVIGHSRGACDTLAFAMHEPGFVADRVEAMFLVQGPFGGSALADYVVGEGTPMDGRMPPGHRLLAHLIGLRERAMLGDGTHAGIAGLTRAASRADWSRILRERAESIAVVGPKIFYIEAQVHPRRLRLFQRAMGWYLRTYYGKNDGLVAAGDQTLPGVGTSLGVLDAGHADLTRRFPATRAGRKARQALVRAIAMAVGGG